VLLTAFTIFTRISRWYIQIGHGVTHSTFIFIFPLDRGHTICAVYTQSLVNQDPIYVLTLLPVPIDQLEVDVSRSDKSIRQPDFVTGSSILFPSLSCSYIYFPTLEQRWKVRFQKYVLPIFQNIHCIFFSQQVII
jgi:hypothetical protein